MKKFYAIYDKDDNFIDCGFTSTELGITANALWCKQRRNKQIGSPKIFEIPLSPQNDIFKEEDEIFLLQEEENVYTKEELAKRQGINVRTWYRLKEKQKKEKIK